MHAASHESTVTDGEIHVADRAVGLVGFSHSFFVFLKYFKLFHCRQILSDISIFLNFFFAWFLFRGTAKMFRSNTENQASHSSLCVLY